MDILRSVLERSSFVDFHRAKIVCSNWYLCSKQTLLPKAGSPLLMLFPEDGCVQCTPDEDKVYKPTKRDFSGIRFLANSGNWFLVVDSGSKLYIIDVFSEKKIDLPPLESRKGGLYSLERIGDKEFKERIIDNCDSFSVQTSDDLRGVLWVDEEKGEFAVVWRFDRSEYVGFCKNGDDHYSDIPTRVRVRRELRGLNDMVLKGYRLYILTARIYIRILDLSGQDGFMDVSDSHRHSLDAPVIERRTATKFISHSENIAVTTSGDVLLVCTLAYEDSTSTRHRIKRDPNQDPNRIRNMDLLEVDSLGDEALFLDSGITVPADRTLGIEPNSIYFTRDDRVRSKTRGCLDICVYNLATKTLKRFPRLSELNMIKDAQWFLPS